MNWGGFPYLTSKLCESGFSVVSFDFSMNGVTKETPAEFSRLDLFAQNTLTAELDELQIVIDHFWNNSKKYNIDREKICLIGHSRGGGTAILKATEDSRVKALVTLASVATFNRYTDKQMKRWRKVGFIEIPNTRTNQVMRMNVTFLEDIERNSDILDIKSAMSRLKKPALLIHGKEDLAVKFTEAIELFESSDKSLTELHILENSGHTFGIEHPFAGTTEPFEEVINKAAGFLKHNL
jgi:dipeptidyl aminopeptidase/acylaminoacyl peptidase